MSKNSFDGFLEDAAQKSRQSRGAACGVARFLETIPPESRTQVEEAMQRPEITVSAIVEALEQRRQPEWHLPRAWAFRTHRRGKCSCGRQE